MAEMTRERLDGFREGLKTFGPMEELCDYDDLSDLIAAVEEVVEALETARGLMHPLAVDGPRLDAILSRYRRNENG